ncbi:MAG TPA: SpoIID/LytB domain-containing protein [bacterium]|nr:SpoIID/LytB domain-containing protein [bacterium]
MRVGKKLVRIPEGLRFSASVVRIDSWSRVPAWDTSGTYNDNLFRGTVELRMENGKLLVINELSMEDMLYGLAEISNDVPVEKAKAIIVSARSYANYYTDPDHRKFKNGEPYDGSDDPNVFQKYLGYGFESRSPKIREYVNATRGEVVTYQGEPIKTWYFTQSDGRTRSEREWCLANGGSDAACVDTPYLQSVPDPGSEGKTRLGHGVGMSGAGATYFAVEKGWDYESILKYFYTGVEVEKIY